MNLQALYFPSGQPENYNGMNKHATICEKGMNKHTIMCKKAGLTLALSLLSSDVIIAVYFFAGIEHGKAI